MQGPLFSVIYKNDLHHVGVHAFEHVTVNKLREIACRFVGVKEEDYIICDSTDDSSLAGSAYCSTAKTYALCERGIRAYYFFEEHTGAFVFSVPENLKDNSYGTLLMFVKKRAPKATYFYNEEKELLAFVHPGKYFIGTTKAEEELTLNALRAKCVKKIATLKDDTCMLRAIEGILHRNEASSTITTDAVCFYICWCQNLDIVKEVLDFLSYF